MSHTDLKTDNMQLYVQCPHCEEWMEINKLNCQIFRHGVLKSNSVQIPPHLPKEQCDQLINNNMIFGCGKPFRVEVIHDKIIAMSCDYI